MNSTTMTKGHLYKNKNWPSPRAKNFARAIYEYNMAEYPNRVELAKQMAQAGGYTSYTAPPLQPPKRWNHENSLDYLAEYADMTREQVLAMHPIDYVQRTQGAFDLRLGRLRMVSQRTGMRRIGYLLPECVWNEYPYDGPVRKTHACLFNPIRPLTKSPVTGKRFYLSMIHH